MGKIKNKKDGMNIEDIQDSNRALIIKQLQHSEECSRVQLAKETGLTQATITKIVRALINSGLVKETGLSSSERGRRTIRLSLNTQNYRVIGVSISSTSVKCCICDFALQQYRTSDRFIEKNITGEDIMIILKQQVDEMLRLYPDVKAIGVAVPGPYLKKEGKIELVTDLGRWRQINICKELGDYFNLPIFIEHNATAGALAFYLLDGIKSNKDIIVHLVIGEGVGAGVIINGNVFSGSQGIAGELGHISIDYNGYPCECGNYGCLEKYCSIPAFTNRTKKLLEENKGSILSELPQITAQDIFKAANENDPFAIRMVEELGTFIARGIITIAMVYNPDTVFISGVVSLGGEILLNRIKETLRRQLLPFVYENLEIVLYKGKDNIMLYGAAVVAINEILTKPTRYLMQEHK